MMSLAVLVGTFSLLPSQPLSASLPLHLCMPHHSKKNLGVTGRRRTRGQSKGEGKQLNIYIASPRLRQQVRFIRYYSRGPCNNIMQT